MRASAAAVTAALMLWTSPAPRAWGMDVHRLITRRALTGLPAALKPFYTARADYIVEHSVDPDLWRIVNLKTDRGDEDPNHFLDIDGLDEPYPFSGVPRSWDAYVARYGAERANRMGRLPWRVEEIYALLVSKFQDAAKNPGGYGADNAAYLSAVVAHYVEDAHQPFHAVVNYDGQATNQRGIHARFESDLVLRNIKTLKLAPVRITPIADVKEFIFAALASGERLAPAILDADQKATIGREAYDNLYFSALFKGTKPLLERRLSESASAVASVITAAWTAAGKPVLSATRTQTPARIRR